MCEGPEADAHAFVVSKDRRNGGSVLMGMLRRGRVCRFSVRDFLRRTKSVAVEEQK
jgi:hypothetical protein